MEGKKQDGEREWGETWQTEPSVPARLARGQSFVHGSVPASRSGLASGIYGQVGQWCRAGEKSGKRVVPCVLVP